MEVILTPLVPWHKEVEVEVEEGPVPDAAFDIPTSSMVQDPVLQLKYRRRALGLPTTAVIPAVPGDPTVQEMRRLVDVFERDFLPTLQTMYARALEEDRTDENGWYRGVRKITGARYEMKVLGDFFATSLTGFEHLPPAMIAYAERQALKDEKVQAMMTMPGGQLTFADWSIILSQKCEAQTIHTDVPVNNVQFGLMMMNGNFNECNDLDADADVDTCSGNRSAPKKSIPGTKVVLREDFGTHSVEELVSGLWADAPPKLRQCLLGEIHPHIYDWCNTILNVFGPMLHPRKELDANMAGAETMKRATASTPPLSSPSPHPEEDPLSAEFESTQPLTKPSTETATTLEDGVLECGDLICTSGGIPHAGPACDHFRMVMFGAASPTPEELYDVDDQFFAHSALLYIMQAVWDYLQEDDDDVVAGDINPSKRYLLRKLADIAVDYDRSIANKHESTSVLFTDFMNVILDLVDENDYEDDTLESVVQHFLRQHGNKSQADLFEHCPPGLARARGDMTEQSRPSSSHDEQ